VVEFDPTLTGVLSGVKVLDFSRLVAGNMLTLQLADHGADVIKVEVPGRGDTLRDWRVDGISAHWKVYGRNKKSITLNLKSTQARDLALRLVANADVLVESFRHRYMENIGLGPDELHAVNPALIMVRISGFGQTGPYSHRPGFGTIVEALSGFASRNGFPDREPVLPPLALADMIAGVYGAFGTMVALQAAKDGAPGQVIDLSLLESFYSVLGPEALTYDLTGRPRKRLGSASEQTAPRNVYRTADGGWIAISSSTEAMTRRFFTAIGRDDLNADPQFNNHPARVANRIEVDRIIGGFIAERTLEANMVFFDAHGITAGPVYDSSQFSDDPHVVERGVLVNLEDPDLGAIKAHAILPRLSETPGQYRRQAPEVGEHNDEVYGEIGLSVDEIGELRRQEVI
jgi:crotonobetainyl-CoA:carnitine CoA-transferase CaiB-like acyl-CoA transferase